MKPVWNSPGASPAKPGQVESPIGDGFGLDLLTPRLVWTNLRAQAVATAPLLPSPPTPHGGTSGPRSRHTQTPRTAARDLVRRHRPGPLGHGPRRGRAGVRRGRQQREERGLRVGPGQLDLYGRQRHDGHVPGARGHRCPEGDPGRPGQRPVHPGGRGQAQLDVHAERVGPGRLLLPRRDGHRHDGRLDVDPGLDVLEAVVDDVHHGRVHDLGHRLHPRLVRPGGLLRRRHLGLRPRRRRRRRPGPDGPRGPGGPVCDRYDVLLGLPVLVGGVGRDGLQRLPERHQGHGRDRHVGDGDRPRGVHLVLLPGHGDQRGGRVGQVGDSDGHDDLRHGRRRRLPAQARGHRLLAELQQRRHGPETLGRPVVLRHHRGGLRRRDVDPGSRLLQPGLRRPERLHRRPVQGGHQGQAGGRQEGHHLGRR